MILFVQAILTALAGYGIFKLWRRVTAGDRTVYWLITAGFLIRAVGGVLAFWISFLHLPVARSLQFGNGLWIFADDARTYFHDAATLAANGPAAILFAARVAPSVFFLQTLATAFLLFGSINSAAILLNLAAYLGTCAVILRFDDPQRHRAVLFAIAAISFSPSVIVWSLQPLKDVFFLFLVTLLMAAAYRWQQVWETPPAERRTASAAFWTAAMPAVLYGISGIRFYLGLMVTLAAIPFAVLAIIRARSRVAAAVSSIVLLPLLFAAFFTGAGPYVPLPIQQAVAGKSEKPLPKVMLTAMDQSRSNFDEAGGATIIGAGHAIQQIDRSLGRKERQTLALRPDERVAQRQRPEASPSKLNMSSNSNAVALQETQTADASAARNPAAAPSPAAAPPISSGATAPESATPRAAVADKTKPAAPPAQVPSPRPLSPVPTIPIAKAKLPTAAPGVIQPPPARPAVPATEEKKLAGPLSVPKHEQKKAASSVAQTPTSVPVVSTQTASPPAPKPEPPRTAGTDNRFASPVLIPASGLARVVAGGAALVLPRAIAQRLGILDVRGGRGLWLFVEVDTLAFDIVVVFTIASLIGAVRRRDLGVPLFWLCLLVTLMLAGALAYTVSNFGTLFRHRDMVLLGLLLVSLAASASATAPRQEAASSLAPETPQTAQA